MHIEPAEGARKPELISELVGHVVRLKDNPHFPLHKDRVVRYMIDRWNGGACFEVLDELCGIDGVTGNLFPEISPVKLFGADFENEDILHVEVDWLGTDGAQVVITYHREAHSRMVREREEAIERARAEAALRYPSLDEVLEGYKALRRTAWLPVFADGPGADMDSRYFGNPWMPNSEKWPTNANGIPLSFVLQINIEKLPGLMRERLGGTGVVAMFYDVDSEWNPQYTDEEPYERDAVLVLYDTNAEGSIRKGRTLEKEPQKVVSWRAVGDYPDTDDLMTEEFLPSRIAEFLKETRLDIGGCLSRKHGSPTPPETVRRFIDRTEELWGAGCCDFETAGTAVDMFCGSGDKLGGWPSWDDEIRWPLHDGRKMEHFLQLDLMDAHWQGFAFWRGDERGRIFFDPAKPDVFKFTWDRGNQ